MLLHEFMDEHRPEIFDACTRKLRESVPANASLDADLKLFFEEVYGALRREAGHRDSRSPLPGKSEAAARLGLEPQRTGIDPAKVPMIFGAISNAVGEVGTRYELEISAAEYKVFNQCMDAGVATSIEHYWDEERQGQRKQVSADLGELAHELRQALGNACLAFKLLRAGEVSVNGKTAGVLGSNLARMELLLTRTLGEVQLKAGATPTLRPLRVARVLRKLHSSFIADRAISLALEADESLHIMADEMLLVSAVSNLLSNAGKFSCRGGRITLRCYAHDDTVVIEVQDECGGLNTEDPSKLLLPFVKGREHSSNVGLGLSITKGAVDAMAGSVRITNHPGQGCTFSLVFPRVSAGPTNPESDS